MLKRMVVAGLALGVAVGMLTSCGGSSTKPSPAPGTGTLITLIGDSPICDVGSFRLTVTGLTLTPVGGGAEVGVIVSTAASAPSIRLNFGTLRDFQTVLTVASVTEGTFDKATVALSLAQLAAYEPTQNPPVKLTSPTLDVPKPTINIQPPLTITKGKVSALRLEIDMLRSIGYSQGQLTGKVSPVITATPVNAAESESFGQLDDLVGFVRSVSTSGATASFIGSFLMQLLSASISGAPTVNVNLTSSTELIGAPALDQLLTDSFVEVDGFFDPSGNFVATSVEVQDQEDPANSKVALIGLVTSLTKDSNGNLTQFSLWVQEEEPDAGAEIPLDSVVVVNLTSFTTYQFSSPSTNFANLTFDPTALAVGQEVVVHGPYTKGSASTGLPATVTAGKVYLKSQSIQGVFSLRVQIGSDDRTGAFQLTPCCTLLQGAPIYVLTNNQTAFVNLSGLGALNAQPALLVKGLAFFQPQAGTVNGVRVPAGTLVVLAKQVHQL